MSVDLSRFDVEERLEKHGMFVVKHSMLLVLTIKLWEPVDFQLRDALLDESWEDLNVDIILFNPPYISRSEIDVMSQETLLFEPEKALFTKTPTAYEKIADKADDVLAADGYIHGDSINKQSQCGRYFHKG